MLLIPPILPGFIKYWLTWLPQTHVNYNDLTVSFFLNAFSLDTTSWSVELRFVETVKIAEAT